MLKLLTAIIVAGVVYSLGAAVFDISPSQGEVAVIVAATLLAAWSFEGVKDWEKEQERKKKADSEPDV